VHTPLALVPFQETDIKDITIQLEDIAKSERMLEGMSRSAAGL